MTRRTWRTALEVAALGINCLFCRLKLKSYCTSSFTFISSYFLAKDYGCRLGYWWHIYSLCQSFHRLLLQPYYPHLPHHIWYFIDATTPSVLNRLDEILKIYKHAMDHGAGAADCKPAHEEQLKISRRMREARGKRW
jgi:hypothetical protein